MSNTRPELRADVNGKMVTRHVKTDEATTQETRISVVKPPNGSNATSVPEQDMTWYPGDHKPASPIDISMSAQERFDWLEDDEKASVALDIARKSGIKEFAELSDDISDIDLAYIIKDRSNDILETRGVSFDENLVITQWARNKTEYSPINAATAWAMSEEVLPTGAFRTREPFEGFDTTSQTPSESRPEIGQQKKRGIIGRFLYGEKFDWER